jgi:hypothetical protein
MKYSLYLVLLCAMAPGCLLAQATKNTETKRPDYTPISVVKQQVDAYNARDIEAFLAPYADSVKIYLFPAKLVSTGKEAMRRTYSQLFSKAPKLHCEITGRLVQDNTVIDNEHITGLGGKPMDGIAIFQIEAGKIAKVYFVE